MNKREKTAFGNYLVQLIKQAGMSQEEFYSELGIAKAYFYDMLTKSPPPIEMQHKILSIVNQKLGFDSERNSHFYDLAAAERNEIPADVAKLILNNPDRIPEIRLGLKEILSAIH